MLITAEQRTALEQLIEIAATGRAIKHEHDNPKLAGELQELVARHKETMAEKDAAAEVVDRFRAQVEELSALIEKRNATITKKTQELNDGTGLTSRDLVNLQEEIAGHEAKVAEFEETELEAMGELESAEAALAAVEATLAEVTAAGRTTQAALKERRSELAVQLERNGQDAAARKTELPAGLVSQFEANVVDGGPGAALIAAPHCQACGEEISRQRWIDIQTGDANETHQCDECEAVLLRRG